MMDARILTSLLKDPSRLYQTPAEELHEAAARYPYSSLLQTLLIKKYQLDGDSGLETALGRAALVHPDRKGLYYFMERQLPHSINKPDKEEVFDALVTAAFEEVEERLEFAYSEEKPVIEPVVGVEPEPLQKIVQEVVPLSEERLAPVAKQPVDIQHDKLSFFDWLKRVREGVVQETKELDEIIQAGGYEAQLVKEAKTAPAKEKRPKKSAAKSQQMELPLEKKVDQMAKNSLAFDDGLVTETLAKLLELQKKYSKALDAYEKLAIKFPDKKTEYMSAIERLKAKLS